MGRGRSAEWAGGVGGRRGRSAWDGMKARYGLFIWNRCTSGCVGVIASLSRKAARENSWGGARGSTHESDLFPGEIPGKNQYLAGSPWPILPGLSGNRRQHHPLTRLPTGYRHDCPRPPEGAGEERAARVGWVNGGERSVGDKTRARYDLLIWNRCTSASCHLIFEDFGARDATPITTREDGNMTSRGSTRESAKGTLDFWVLDDKEH